MDDIDTSYFEWVKNPEPPVHTPDPNVVLDTNVQGVMWLYDEGNASKAWVTYHGEPAKIVE